VTPYDAIRYPGLPYADTHPDRLAATAIFYGMNPASPDRCRVLEVGCGDGGNLVPMAYGLLDSTFVGIDLAGEAIEAARALALRAGVANVTFEALDLTHFAKSAGVFDFIIAHGVYSWIPADVRDALMALIGRHLAPQGVAFVSYNTYPGCHLRQMVWEMLKFHTAELADAQARVSEAQALIGLIAHGNAQPDEYTQPLVVEAQRIEDRLPALLFHDDLSPINDPVYFHQFAEHASRHGLQFLAEAAFVTSSYVGIAPEARSVLATLDPITRQQYLDFIKCRRFRETLLCRNEVAVDRQESPERMRRLAFTAARRVRAAPQDGSVSTAGAEPSGAVADGDADTAVIKALLDILRAAIPNAPLFDAVVERLRTRLDGEQLLARANVDVEAVMLASLLAGIIEPHVIAPRLACPPGDRPTASAVVRAQLVDGDVVTSMWHYPVKVDDEIAKRLLPLLDGMRNRSELLAAIGDLVAAPGASAAEALDEHLHRLARLGLLVA
jgi:SAM-dependent methyltransferase